MKILLIGANGQVGHELQRTLLPLGDVLAWRRADADLARPETLPSRLSACAPDLIVNAAAYTAVDQAEANQGLADTVNAAAVAALATYAAQAGIPLVHYSTDYVFDGSGTRPYRESDTPAPLNAYGRSKLAGEQAIARSGCQALVFRISWVVSGTGANFVKTVLRLAASRDSLRMVDDQFGAPTAAELVADTSALAIAAYRRGGLTAGVYHLTAAGETSWCRLARHVVARARRNGAALMAGEQDIAAITTAEYPLPATRPQNSRMDCSALSQALGLQLPHWTIHVDRVVDQLTKQED
ncbi:dTDP-4-dehydrorhamnose reductase [Achromobacter ruhlandii]|uniref:dTDP-4-dehydrorhamnose reductase n=1 Tax=Achromobacter ruhlandii TaxID=72557 RepID=UPI003B9CE65F